MPSAIAISPPRSHRSQRLRQSLMTRECSRSRRADSTEGSAPGNRSTDFLHNWICTAGGSLQQRCGSSPPYGRRPGAGGAPGGTGPADGTAAEVTSTRGEAARDRSGRGARRSPCTGQRPHRANGPRKWGIRWGTQLTAPQKAACPLPDPPPQAGEGIKESASAVGESRTPTIVRSPEPESESRLNHRRELAPWRGQLPHGVTERHAPPRPSGGRSGGA